MFVRLLLLLAVMTIPVCAHVGLDTPNGGKVMVPGTIIKIQWQVVFMHNTQYWHLYYSNSGPAGPWIPIILNLQASETWQGTVHYYYWVVPNDASNFVRIKVVQDNLVGTDYEDISDSDNIIAPPALQALPSSLSATSGGTHVLTINFPDLYAGQPYVIGGGWSGLYVGNTILPPIGMVFGQINLPIIPDMYTDWTRNLPNPHLAGFAGTLDAGGAATSQIMLPANAPPWMVGTTVHHCAVAVVNGSAVCVTEPEPLTINP